MRHKTKQTLFVILAIIAIIAGFIAIENHREANRAAYAKANNCTWEATGTWYGDDRDFICKERS